MRLPAPKNMANNMSPTTMMVGPTERDDLSVTAESSQQGPDRAPGGLVQGVRCPANGHVTDPGDRQLRAEASETAPNRGNWGRSDTSSARPSPSVSGTHQFGYWSWVVPG